MYIQKNKTTGKNGKVYSAILLCKKYRQDGKIKTKVLANLSNLPLDFIQTLDNILKQGTKNLIDAKNIIVRKAIDYGLVFLVIHLMDKLRISSTLDKIVPQHAAVLKTIIVGKIISRGSKLEIYNWIMRNPIIASKIGVNTEKLKVDDLYYALSMADMFQEKIEQKWFTCHNNKQDEDIFLYDITSTYFEGTENELAEFGYNRDKKKGKKQINIGLITKSNGFPLKIEAFKGSVNDHKTVLEQINHLKNKFQARNMIFVGDRGMKIRFNLAQLKASENEGIDYITGLTKAEIEELIEKKVIDLNLFTKELAEIESEGVRYVLSENPQLKQEEQAYLNHFKLKIEKEILKINTSWQNRHQKNIENIEKLKTEKKNKKLVTQFTEKNLDQYKKRIAVLLSDKHANKYYEVKEISNTKFEVEFKEDVYKNSLQMAGKYVVMSTIKSQRMDKEEVRETYKKLQSVEHAFRDFKSDNIQLRPVYHRNEAQTRGHVFMSMFSYSIIKEMEDKIFPFLKIWNKEKGMKLSFEDVKKELTDIKRCTLNFGKEKDEIKITELNPFQTEILKLFQMKISDLENEM